MNASTCLPAAPVMVDPGVERSRRAPFVPHRRITGRTMIWCFLLSVGLVCPVVTMIALLPLPTMASDATRPLRFLNLVLHPGPLFLKAVIIAPIWEELFYRGLILPLGRRFLPTWAAVVTSTAIFVLPHLANGLGTASSALVLGLIMAWLVIRTGSLYASIVFHATFNLCWLFVLGPAFGITEKIISYTPGMPALNPLTDVFPAWWIAVSLVLSIAGFRFLVRDNPRPR